MTGRVALTPRPPSRAGRCPSAREAEQLAEHLAGVLTEARRAGGRDRRFADPAGVGRLLAQRPDDRVVDGDEVAAGGDVGVGEDVGRGVGGRDRHVVLDAAPLDLAGGERRRSSRRRSR